MTSKLIVNGAVYTDEGWIDKGYLLVQDGRIASLDKGNPPDEISRGATDIIDASNCAILPGLTNAHTHLSQTFMRGLAGGRPLMEWLNQVIWPLQKSISSEELYLASLLGLVENLRYGVTEVTNHHKITQSPAHTDAVLKAAREIGLRFTLARAWSDMGQSPEDPQLIIDDLDRLFDLVENEPKIKIANGPLALWRCSAETLIDTHNLALQHGSFTHSHVSESKQEVERSLKAYGLRPVEWLDSMGILDQFTQIVHAVWVNPEEIKRIKARGAVVIHCPVSNAVLGSGVAPLVDLIREGIPLRFGTDGSASNDTQDIWETIKFAVCLARAVALDPTILSPGDALSLALGNRFLKVGIPADLIIVDLNHPRSAPVIDLNAALVLGGSGGEIKTVLVDGEELLADGKINMLDEDQLLKECNQAIYALRRRAGSF